MWRDVKKCLQTNEVDKIRIQPMKAVICSEMILYCFFVLELLYFLVRYCTKVFNCKNVNTNKCTSYHTQGSSQLLGHTTISRHPLVQWTKFSNGKYQLQFHFETAVHFRFGKCMHFVKSFSHFFPTGCIRELWLFYTRFLPRMCLCPPFAVWTNYRIFVT